MLENKFDYGHYRKYYNDTIPIIRSTWRGSPPNFELEAKSDYSSIDLKDLEAHFLNIINEIQSTISQLVYKNFESRINQLKIRYKEPYILNHKILEYKTYISDYVYSDSCIYRRAFQKAKNLKSNIDIDKNIAKLSVELIEQLPLSIDRLINITDYKTNTFNSILYDKLYKRYVKNNIESFTELVRVEIDFNNIINLLEKHSAIKIYEDGYKWNEIDDPYNLKPTTLMCSFALTLQDKNYFKRDYPNKQIVDLLNSFFNMNLKSSYYGKVKKNKTKFEKYFKHFNYIPIIHN